MNRGNGERVGETGSANRIGGPIRAKEVGARGVT